MDKTKLEHCAQKLYEHDASLASSYWNSWQRATVAKQNKYIDAVHIVLEAAKEKP